jgi:hypothetical protein
MSASRGPSQAGLLTTAGIAAFALLCYGAPLLIAGGALTGLGALVRSWWLIGPGIAALLILIGWGIVRRRRGLGTACPPRRNLR